MPVTNKTTIGVRGRPPRESVSARANVKAKGQTPLDKTSLEDHSTSRVETEPQGVPGIVETGVRGAKRSLLPWNALHNDV